MRKVKAFFTKYLSEAEKSSRRQVRGRGLRGRGGAARPFPSARRKGNSLIEGPRGGYIWGKRRASKV